jgi:sRNA-binding protein
MKYQKCLAVGGARFDLEGNVAGEVSRQQRCRASRMVARIKARQLAEAATAKTEAESKAAVRKAATRTSMLNGKVTPPPAQTTPPGSGRLGLADLKRAALERRARQEAGAFLRRASALPSTS